MYGGEKLVFGIGVLIVLGFALCGLLTVIDNYSMATKGYEQAYEPITKKTYWVKVQQCY